MDIKLTKIDNGFIVQSDVMRCEFPASRETVCGIVAALVAEYLDREDADEWEDEYSTEVEIP